MPFVSNWSWTLVEPVTHIRFNLPGAPVMLVLECFRKGHVPMVGFTFLNQTSGSFENESIPIEWIDGERVLVTNADGEEDGIEDYGECRAQLEARCDD